MYKILIKCIWSIGVCSAVRFVVVGSVQWPIISGSDLDLDFIYGCGGDIYSFLSIVILVLFLKYNCFVIADWCRFGLVWSLGNIFRFYFYLILILIHNMITMNCISFSVFSYLMIKFNLR